MCERCSLCKSLSFCPSCHKCPQCCQKSTCGRPSPKILAGLALSGFKSKGSVHNEGRSFPTLQSKTPSVKVTSDIQWLCKSSQKQASERILAGLNPKTGGGKGSSSLISSLLQPVISGAKAQQQVEAHSKPKTIRLSLQQVEWVTSLDFSDAYFHVPISQRSRKFLRFHLNSLTYQFTTIPFGLSTARLEFTKVAKEVMLMVQARGIRIHQYLDDWLLRGPEPVPQQVFNFVGYCFDLSQGLVKPTQERWIALSENQPSFGTGDLLGQVVHVPNRTSDSHRKANGVGTLAHEAYSMAFKEALACPRSPGKDHSPAKVSPSSSEVVVGPKQSSERSTFTPL